MGWFVPYMLLAKRHHRDPPPGDTRNIWALTFLLLVLVGLVLVGLALSVDRDCTEWLSWRQSNTYPNCHSFKITEEGKDAWFGSIKALYDLEVYPGQYICARVDASNKNYAWMVLLYYGKPAEPGADQADVRSHQAHTMFQFGSDIYPMRDGEIRCGHVPPIYHYGKRLPGPFVVFKVHWIGFGEGGVVAKPTVIISDTDLSRED
jgi:hypothetical protein